MLYAFELVLIERRLSSVAPLNDSDKVAGAIANDEAAVESATSNPKMHVRIISGTSEIAVYERSVKKT